MFLRRLAVVSFLASLCAQAVAQDVEDEVAVADTARQVQRWGVLPAIAYSEETSLQVGALVMHFFPSDIPDGMGSEIAVAYLHTFRKQDVLDISPDLRFLEERLQLTPTLELKDWPARYFGIGNASTPDTLREYHQKRASLDSWATYDVGARNGFKLAAQFRLDGSTFSWEDSASVQDGGAIPVPGRLGDPHHDAGLAAGPGYRIEYDARDHENWPRHGWRAYHQLESGLPGISDFSFVATEQKAEIFFPLPYGSAFGAVTTVQTSYGSLPFYRLPGPDGSKVLRGMENGLWRDRHMAAVQGELRFPLFWRFGGTLFAEGARVASQMPDLLQGRLHRSFGAGGRFALNPSRRVNVRGDLSLVDGELGMVVYLREAF